ncbi:MAG: autotransporter-associated beta strand repeat-containing protein [Kiritimatiellia bacterium]
MGNIAVTGTSSLLQGTGSVTKTGAGTLTLSQANTYAGTTTVQRNALMLTGSVPGLINVSSGATLGGGGSGGSIRWPTTAVLSPGELDGNVDNILSAASLTLADTTVLHVELGIPQQTYYTDPGVGSYFTDHVAVAGALVLDGAVRIANRPMRPPRSVHRRLG